MVVTLMNKTYPVLEMEGDIVNINKTVFPTFSAKKIKIIDSKRIPFCLMGVESAFLTQAFNDWFSKKRCISTKRESLKKITCVRWHEQYPHFFSMSDQYWIRYNDKEKWEKLNFRKNNYSNIVGLASASYSLERLPSIILSYNCPDLTTNGIQDKMWVRKDGENYLLKWANKNKQNVILSELLATKALRKINIVPFVQYDLVIENYRLCARCKNFIGDNEEFIPAWQVCNSYAKITQKEIKIHEECYDILMDAIKYYNIPHMEYFIDNMIIADRLIMNFDRHLGNFGFIRNVDTGEFVGPAPLFDFGSAFFPDMANTKKDRYIFNNRAKVLLETGKMKEHIPALHLKNDEIFTVPCFEDFLEAVEKNIILNNKEITKMSPSHSHEEKKFLDKDK